MKLRRVYLKEWEDRKNGVDDDVIMGRRHVRIDYVILLITLSMIYNCYSIYSIYYASALLYSSLIHSLI